MLEIPEGDWTAWSRNDWNRALCDHYFAARGSSDSPITRLVVTPTALARVTGEPGADPDQVQEAFLETIRQPRIQFNDTLQQFQWITRGMDKSAQPPPFLAHLILTCLVASSVDDDLLAENNFRNRLAHLLGNPEGESYPLSALPHLWFTLRDWLDARRRKQEAFRRLVLPDPGSATIIGYSLRLAFPSRKDELALAEIFHSEGFGEEPPVSAVLNLVGSRTHRFSNAFVEAYLHFRRAFGKGSSRLFDDPFWTAVREAASVDYQRRARKEDTDFQLVLLVNRENGADLYLVAEDNPRRLHKTISFQPSEGTLGEYEFVVSANVQSRPDGFAWAVELLLNGALQNALPRITRTPVWHVVQEGVLLFVADESNVYQLARSRPATGRVRAVLRQDLSAGFLAVFPSEERPAHRPSRHSGWTETSAFDAGLLAHFDAIPHGPLADVRCLQRTLLPPSIHLFGGIRVPGGYLGIPSCMPWVSPSELADQVVLKLRASETEEGGSVTLVEVTEPANTFVFPPHAATVTGAGTLVAFRGNRIVARRRIAFHSELITPEYKAASEPGDWVVEGGGPDVVPLSDAGPEAGAEFGRSISLQTLSSGGGTGEGRGASFVLRPADFAAGGPPPSYDPTPEDEEKQAQFVECCAGLACRKAGLPESEFLDRVIAQFRIEEGSPLVWDIVRGWVEAGAFDRGVNLRWRGRKYFARKPRFVLWRERSRVHGTLVGLGPSATRSRTISVAEQLGAELLPVRTHSPWVPAALRWSAESADTFDMIAQEAYLEESQWLRPASSSTSTIPDVGSAEHEEPLNYESVAWWDWNRHAFSFSRRVQGEAVSVEWLRRTDRPDRFRVWSDEDPFWASSSRNWALLVAHSLVGRPPYSTAGEADLVRSTPGQVYLPLPIGRTAFIRGPAAPGPGPEGGYVYSFASPAKRSEILSLLWGGDRFGEPDGRVRWLLSLARSSGFARQQRRVAIPLRVLELLPALDPQVETIRRVGIPIGLLPHLERALKTMRSRA